MSVELKLTIQMQQEVLQVLNDTSGSWHCSANWEDDFEVGGLSRFQRCTHCSKVITLLIVAVWDADWKGEDLDNMAVMSVISIFCWQSMITEYVPRIENQLADALSCNELPVFLLLIPSV